ncbi:MAG: hypothetical protein ACYCZY_05055 [Lacisediminihabitans sp.]
MASSIDRPHTIVFKPDADDRLACLQDARFFSPAYWGPSGWLGMGISYRHVALQLQPRALDSLRP